MTSRVNNPESCICCSRRADGLAVGRPQKLGWFCRDCGPDLARKALHMDNRTFDTLENLVAEQVAKDAANGDVTLTPKELPEFIRWCVTHFADTMRKHVESGKAPF
jgi:hypothetical protein